MNRQYALQETWTDLRGDVILLRLCLQGLLENATGRRKEELCGLWRLTDYLEQHVGEAEQLLQ